MDRKKITSNVVLIFIAVSLILLRFVFLDNKPDSDLTKLVGQKIILEGQVVAPPDERDATTRYTFEIANSPTRLILISDRFPSFNYGQELRVAGTLQLPENFMTDSGAEFDYVSYLAKDQIYFLMYRPQIEVLGNEGNPVFKFLFGLKNYFVEKISRVVPEPNSSLMNGLLFGARQTIGEDLLTAMKNVGLIHIVAISGYNVTIVASGILGFTSYFLNRRKGFLVSAIAICLFAIMVGLGSTVIRASIMALIAILARYLGRPNHALRALAVAVFGMLIWNPSLLWSDPSFQLSVTATLGLILFSPIVSQFIGRKLPWITEKWGIRETVSTTFAVQLFLLPLLLRMSGIFSPISFLVNLIVLPIIPATMLAGFLTGALGILSKIISWPFGALGYLLTEFILQVVQISSKIPFAFLQIGSLPRFLVLLWYAFYAWTFWKLSSMTDQFKLAKKSSI